jgi:hypothetical protein
MQYSLLVSIFLKNSLFLFFFSKFKSILRIANTVETAMPIVFTIQNSNETDSGNEVSRFLILDLSSSKAIFF